MKIGKLWALAMMALLGMGFQQAYACNYASKMRLYQKYLQRWLDDPSVGNTTLLCNLVRGIDIKFKNKPGKPTPPLPDGLDCSMANRGGGRGGGPGAVVVGIGQGAGTYAWVRNHNDVECMFTWTINPDPGNPPGFSFSETTGMINVPGLRTDFASFDVFVDAGVPNGAMAFFTVEWIDGCTGLPLFDDWAEFKVTADSQISVTPVLPLNMLAPGPPLIVSYRVVNHTAAAISRPYTYFSIGDPQSLGNLNSGGTYQINNIFQTDKSISGGTADVPPLSELIIDKVPLLPGEFCDPEMLSCCGLDFGGATCCAFVFNDDFTPQPIPPLFHDLVGVPEGIGNIGFQIGEFAIQIPANPVTPLPEQLEQLALQALNQAQNLDGFNFMPMLDQEGLLLMHAPDLPSQFFSTDPGVQWQPLLPPVDPLLPEFQQEMVTILPMIEIVNGWAFPPLPPQP